MNIKTFTPLFIFLCCLANLNLNAKNHKDSIANYVLADSMKPTGLLQKITINAIQNKKEVITGIVVDDVKLFFESEKKEREIVMNFPATATLTAKGIGVELDEPGELEFEYNWQLNETYQLYIGTATDSAQNFILYSGYVFLPKQNKWKLIGTCKVAGKWGFIKTAQSIKTQKRKPAIHQKIHEVWYQKSNGNFKLLISETEQSPVLSPFSSIDSATQFIIDSNNISNTLQKQSNSIFFNTEGVFYSILKEGEGQRIEVTDTVTVHYKGYIFETDSIFDQTKQKAATFPLNRLIKGWQIAIPKIKVGGSVKIIIPSGLAYSIRTRSPKIPPNSNLVFEISVLSSKPKL